jgi:hypothetical protein
MRRYLSTEPLLSKEERSRNCHSLAKSYTYHSGTSSEARSPFPKAFVTLKTQYV